jgi:hypothetical protein
MSDALPERNVMPNYEFSLKELHRMETSITPYDGPVIEDVDPLLQALAQWHGRDGRPDYYWAPPLAAPKDAT